MKYDFEPYEATLTEKGIELPEAFTKAVGEDEIYFLNFQDKILAADSESFKRIIEQVRKDDDKEKAILFQRYVYSKMIRLPASDAAEALRRFKYTTGTKFRIESGNESLRFIEIKE